MSAGWLDKRDNPGMASLELESDDVNGLVVTVNFADLTMRVAATADFLNLHPVEDIDHVESLLLGL
jgi:hypothetical protein